MIRRTFAMLSLVCLYLSGTAAVGRCQVPELINDKEFRPVARAAVDSIYNFQFRGANKLLEPWRKRYPEHPIWPLMEGMELWWKVLSDLEDTSQDEEFYYKMKRTDYQATKWLSKHPSHADALIVKAISNGYIARQHANREEWITSVNSARKAIRAYGYLAELQPGLPDLKLAEGLKLYYSAYLPEAYPVVRTVSWLLPEGNRKRGLENLKAAADSAIFARAEAVYFLGNINYNYENNYERAVGYFEELHHKYPRNSYYVRKLVRSLYRMERHSRAMKIINSALESWERHQWPFREVLVEELMTWRGSIQRRRDQTTAAISSYRHAFEAGKDLPGTHNRSYHLASGYYLGRLLYREKQFGEALHYLNMVIEGNAESEFVALAKDLKQEIESRI